MSTPSIHIDFAVLNTNDPKFIWIADNSNWGVALTQPSYLSILIPGAVNWFNLSYVKKSLTTLNSVNLDLSCLTQCADQKYQDLPDGIWEFCLKSGYEGIEKKRIYLKSDQLRNKLNEIRINLYDTQGFSFKKTETTERLEIIEGLLETANALVSESRGNDAMKAYNEALRLTNTLIKCKDCI